MPTYQFHTVDVFTTTRFGGNPLAVILDARGLSTAQMQAIAREFNYSESTFVLPPTDPAHTAQVRIFTPTQEVPFAGHPNVGTACVLASIGSCFDKPVGSTMMLEEVAGLVAIHISGSGPGTRATITAPEPLSTRPLNPEIDLSACVGLTPADIATDIHQPIVASVGLQFAFAQVTNLDALARAIPDTAAFTRANSLWGNPGLGLSIMLFTPLADTPHTVRARMFAPLDGVPEDPATGSASGALGGLLAHLNPSPGGEFNLTIQQGVEMGRPSLIEVTSIKRQGRIDTVQITGQSVAVTNGALTL